MFFLYEKSTAIRRSRTGLNPKMCGSLACEKRAARGGGILSK